MKILIAGNGFIGRNTAEKVRENHIVKTLDIGKETTFQQDITQEFSLEEEFDVLIHTIGLAPGMYSGKKYRKVHVEGTRNLLNGVKCEKVIYLSAMGAGKIDHSFFRTKKKAEKIIQEYGEKYTVLRPSTVYGEGNHLLDLIRRVAPTRIFPDIKTRTQPIHVDDLTDIVSESLKDLNNQALELGGPEKMTLGELGKKIYREQGYSCTLVPIPGILAKTGFIVLNPLPGPFNRENIQLMEYHNTTERNDAEHVLDSLKKI